MFPRMGCNVARTVRVAERWRDVIASLPHCSLASEIDSDIRGLLETSRHPESRDILQAFLLGDEAHQRQLRLDLGSGPAAGSHAQGR